MLNLDLVTIGSVEEIDRLHSQLSNSFDIHMVQSDIGDGPHNVTRRLHFPLAISDTTNDSLDCCALRNALESRFISITNSNVNITGSRLLVYAGLESGYCTQSFVLNSDVLLLLAEQKCEITIQLVRLGD